MIFDLVLEMLFGRTIAVNEHSKPTTKKVEMKETPKKEEEITTPFSNEEIGYIISRMGKDMYARLSPHGNVILKHKSAGKTLFSFYKRDNGILIRRRLGYDNPYGSGNILNGGNTFPTLKSAMDYFVRYREKYPNSLM